MADLAARYCSDCAWPYECGIERDCRRRAAGDVRGPSPNSNRIAALAAKIMAEGRQRRRRRRKGKGQ